jgi:tripartite-type tricarboxylate transporter receptor subunit TctC
MKRYTATFLLAIASVFCATAFAQSYPAKPIRLIVPFAPGGTADVLGRILGQQLSQLYGQPVVVENKPGAAGNLGAEAVAKSSPDGYTLMVGTIGIHAAYKIYSHLNYDPSRDLQPVSLLAEFPNLLIVNPALPVHTLKEFMAAAKQGELFFGSAGFGSSTHMAGELFKHVSGLNLKHVPYKGSGPALADLIGGQIQVMFENLPTALPMVKSGKARAIGVTSRTRNPSLPDVPSIAEAGLPAYDFTAWFTVAAPRGMPPEILNKLNADINNVMRSAALAPKWQELGVTPMGGTVNSAETFIAAETQKWNNVIASAHLRVD